MTRKSAIQKRRWSVSSPATRMETGSARTRSEYQAHKELKESRYHSAWKVPSAPKRTWWNSVRTGVMIGLVICIAAVLGQMLLEVVRG